MSDEERPAKIPRTDDGDGGQEQRQLKKPKEKKNRFPLRRDIDLACRRGDAAAALEALDKAHQQTEEKLEAHSYNAILALCANGGRMINSVEAPEPDKPVDKEVARALRERAAGVYEKMKAANIKPTETTFTALAIIAAKDGDADRSFEMAKQVAQVAKNARPKLRTFAPWGETLSNPRFHWLSGRFLL